MDKSIIILGASTLQLPLIKYIKSRGYNVIVVSIPGLYPGFSLADKCIYCDVRDVNAILNEVRNDEVIAVLTDETDIAVPAVALLNKALGLSGNDPITAEAYSNKYLMRQRCIEVGVHVPRFFRASTVSDIKSKSSQIIFPVVIKPEDSQGSRGVYMVNNVEQISEFFEKSVAFSKTKKVIVEEYFQGKEFVVEGFVQNGEYLNFGIGERKYFNLDGLFIPSQTLFPSKLSEDKQRLLLDAERKLHHYLNPSFGMIHSEYLVNEDTNDYILVETALRGGGVYISSHLVPLYCGINNYKMLLDCALGHGIDMDHIEREEREASSGYVCFTLPEGDITSIQGVEDVKKMDSVVAFDLDGLTVGKHVEKMINKTQRLGPIIVKANNRTDLELQIIKIQETLRIEVITSKGDVQNIIWN